MREAEYLKTQAKKCRRLAGFSKEREATMLNEMAAEYEARARALEESP